MFSLLDPRLWIGVALAIALSSGAGYFKGRHDGRLLERADAAASVAQANHEARKNEQLRQDRVDEAAKSAAARSNDDRARLARANGDVERMRGTLAAAERAFAQSSDAAAKTAAALRADLGSCVAEYRSLGEEAAGYASDSLMYQQAWPK